MTHGQADAWLADRGPYWIERMAVEYDLHVTKGRHPWWFFSREFGKAGLYGLTVPRDRTIWINIHLFQPDGWQVFVDEMLCHELVHATNPPGASHGAEFKRRYARIYPWATPGPVTEFDPGTPRRVIWRNLKRAVPRV